jgi:exosortase family protein XrtM
MPSSSVGVRFLARALALAALFYAAIYLNHAPDSVAVRALGGYLAWVARASAGIIGVFDPSAAVHGASIGGRFPLEIVLDCGALDVQAIFAAAVLAFPAPWRKRALGLVVGLTALTLLNLARIAALAFIGAAAPTWFHTMHEEVFQIVLVIVPCLGFSLWALWARPRQAVEGQPLAVG